jgi:hypothetical protein
MMAAAMRLAGGPAAAMRSKNLNTARYGAPIVARRQWAQVSQHKTHGIRANAAADPAFPWKEDDYAQ